MTPKEKARELFEKVEKIKAYIIPDYLPASYKEVCKACAMICVDEMMSQFEKLHKPEYVAFMEQPKHLDGYELVDFWQQVKTEIEVL